MLHMINLNKDAVWILFFPVCVLSLSEPSLLTPGQNVSSAGCSGARRSSVLQTRPPPPPSTSKPSTLMICGNFSRQHQQNQHLYGCSRPAYIHFSQAIRPSVRPRPVRRPSHNPALGAEKLHGDLQRRDSSSSQGEALSVVGKPCFLSCSQRPADSAGPSGRAQLHVFLPSEAEAEEGDGEPVDEGFMDEPDCSATSLKLQHKVPQTLADDI